MYRCGFASERAEYHLIFWDESGANQIHFAPDEKHTAGDKMKKWMAANPDVEIMDKQRVVYPEREESALEAVRTQLYSIERAVREKYGIREFSDISVILSGPGNYREKLATRFPYKGNRDSDHKPYWYQSIRNYLTGAWGATVVSGREADDECSIIAWEYLDASPIDTRRNVQSVHCAADTEGGTDFCVATIDKDLDQIPGPHYNYLKSVHYNMGKSDAQSFFWQQCLSGDATDGIPGCYRVGEAIAKRTVDEFFSAGGGVTAGGFNGRIYRRIVEVYEQSTDKAGCPYARSDAAAIALETARLVYLQQKEGELWIPEGPPHAKLEEYVDE